MVILANFIMNGQTDDRQIDGIDGQTDRLVIYRHFISCSLLILLQKMCISLISEMYDHDRQNLVLRWFIIVQCLKIYVLTDRQTDRQTDTLTNRQMNGQTNRHTDKQASEWTNRQTNRQTDTLTNRQMHGQTDRQTYRHTEKQADEWTDRHTDTLTNRQMNGQTGR